MDFLAPLTNYKAGKLYEEVHTHFIRDEYEDAEKKAKRLLEAYPQHTKTLLLLAQISFNRHKYQRARERYNKILEYTADTEARFGRAQSSFLLRKYEDALNDYLFLYETSFKAVTYLVKLGETFHALWLEAVALRYYQKAVTLAPTSIEAHMGLAQHLVFLGRYTDARDHTAHAKNLYYQHKNQITADVLVSIETLDHKIESHIKKKPTKKKA